MDEPIYSYKKSYDILTFDFESIGPNGISKKQIVYSSLEETEDIFSLSLFEVFEDGHDVYFESKNKDLTKIMATVLRTMLEFFDKYPSCKIGFTGSEPKRTRLYRTVISKIKSQVDFLRIEAISLNGEIVDYEPNENYLAYVISLKNT
ncbi:hypothetical protein VB796_04285 [Arcicella sp. LKC2W]|uniref:DUF6934 family protein n=1 Tax=Arcicella sp. LKC2W TaxID=2984198 RepID=UPI002B205FEE|nr:hypothetical protein [Arcicella sp. LKC2W]MEA5458239.1 hypothetical protein [Arcicella sp. LKC2W]